MFDDQTCLILGAGASRPYGFPTSGELRQLLLGQDVGTVFTALGFTEPAVAAEKLSNLLSEAAFQRESKLERFRRIFGESQRISIDAFIGGLPENEGNAELATIARNSTASILLMCEEQAQLNGDWYQWLLEFILRKGKNLPSGRLKVVTFNYDRSLEIYLFRAFMRSFDLQPPLARELADRIEIAHVYGSLGPVLRDSHPSPVVFGDLNKCFVAADQLALATPRVDPDQLRKIRGMVDEADRLIFLGFGFWPENLDLLRPEVGYEPWHSKEVFSSCFRLWRSTKIDVDTTVGYRAGKNKPLINWGEPNQTILDFVTHWNLKGKAPD